MQLTEEAPPLVKAHPAIARWKWAVVWVMFLATMINYMDRQTMTSNSTHIMKEFHLNEEGYGWLEFWFGIAFAMTQFPAGFLADRLNLRWLYAGALLVWSAAGFATGLAHTMFALATCRIILGIGESFNWPCAVAVVRRLLPREARSMANGIFHSGASIGAGITPILVVMLVGPNGENWRWVFQAVGAAGLIWAILWFWCMHGARGREISKPIEPELDESDSTPAALPGGATQPFKEVFAMRQFWITLVVGITVNIPWHFYRVWLPRLLVRDLGFTTQHSQYVMTGFYVAADLGCMTAGYMIRRLALRMSMVKARQTILMATSLVCLVSIPEVLFKNPWAAIPLTLLFGAGAMGGFAIFFTLTQEISGPHTAKCLGLIGGTVWFILAGLQPLVGKIVDHIGTFDPIVMAVGLVPLVGALFARSWPEPKTPNAAAGAFQI